MKIPDKIFWDLIAATISMENNDHSLSQSAAYAADEAHEWLMENIEEVKED